MTAVDHVVDIDITHPFQESVIKSLFRMVYWSFRVDMQGFYLWADIDLYRIVSRSHANLLQPQTVRLGKIQVFTLHQPGKAIFDVLNKFIIFLGTRFNHLLLLGIDKV